MNAIQKLASTLASAPQRTDVKERAMREIETAMRHSSWRDPNSMTTMKIAVLLANGCASAGELLTAAQYQSFIALVETARQKLEVGSVITCHQANICESIKALECPI